jgi:hypothetical protein
MGKTSNAQFVRDNKPDYWRILIKNKRNKKSTYDEIKSNNPKIPFSIYTFYDIVAEWVKEESNSLRGNLNIIKYFI